MCREFHRVMGEEGPSHTTLLRYSIGKAQRRHVVTERYVREAIRKVTVEFIQKELSESEKERERVKKELRQAEIRFRQLVENARDVIYRYRFAPPPGFEYKSPVSKDMLGYAPEEFYADPKLILKLVHPDDRERLEKSLEGKGPFYERDTLRWVHRDGRLLWIERVNVPIYDEAGNLVAMEGIARDVTERKRVEEALRESEERFRNLVEHTNDILWELDQGGAYTYISPNVKGILGYGPEHLIGKTPFEFMPEEEAKRVGQIFAQIVQKGRSFTSLQHQALCKDGKVILLECSGVPITNGEGTVQGYRGIDRDITKRGEV